MARKKKKTIKPIYIILLLILLAGVGVGIYLYSTGKLDKFFKNEESSINNQGSEANPSQSEIHIDEDGILENIIYDDFQIHFLELGNTDAGDSVFIKAGDNDILIDAGSTQSSATTIEEYIDNYCLDGKLEYVISTHGHMDHIAGMVGNTSTNLNKYKNKKGESVSFADKDGTDVSANGILSYYDIDIIIDFGDKTNSTAAIVQNYNCALNYAVGKGAKHYSAGECFNNENGAKRTYSLGDDMSFDILYNYYYFNTGSDENDYSVCTMFNYKNYHFILTGDLEENGEERLVTY